MRSTPIYINARFLTQPVTGVQRFAIELSRQLKYSGLDVHFVAPQNILQKDIARDLKPIIFGKLQGHLWEQIELPFFLRRRKSPLLINFANTAPLLYGNQIVTIHDLAFRVNPAWFSKAFTGYYNFLIPKIARNAKKILTVSNSIKQELENAFDLSHDKIEVVYNAASITSVKLNATEEIIKELPKKYILIVSSLDARKNFSRLIKAFGLIKSKNVTLLIIGGKNKIFADSTEHQSITGANSIKFMGYVSDQQLRLLYENATIFIYPSLYEGFGIPNLEAMQASCPVITSNIEAIKEVCSDAVAYIDPYDEEEIAKKIDLLLSDEDLREELRHKGFARSQQFTWEKSAAKLIRTIQEVASPSQFR